MIFAPLNVAAFLYIPRALRGAAVGLLALLRNEGGSVGTSVAQTILERREQFHALRLGEGLDALNPVVQNSLQRTQMFFLRHVGDPASAQRMALQVLERARDRAALSLAYFDAFWTSAALAAVLVGLVWLMRRSVAEKGAQVMAE
jgi:DHA2 family multidrug resistance protein